ncbi:rho GTPase-activating protein 20 isoform X2 [Nasonia vitripennis]|uniref:Rho-GAP domain-containing protein n=1 Tax=Nasonia vitripennis TaxID=7425 RepID=A0A7M7T6Z8_NASVI|nr:rho GTPase-activating protein 20 isoform X2 [Nasonia vitripennis]
MTMFGSIVQRLTSPVTSPMSSRSRRFKSPSRWEVQSEPEDEGHQPSAGGGGGIPARKSRAKHLLDKRKSKSRARGLHFLSAVGEPQQQLGGSGGSWPDAAFPPLRGTKSLGRLDGIKEVQRLADYERYLGQEPREHGNASFAGRVQLEGDLHRIQELFPNDNLRLHEQHVLTTKAKNVLRKRNNSGPGNGNSSRQQPRPSAPKAASRAFLLETPVQFTTGMQSQERHLFLFSDLLLVAKPRNGGGTFKLKQSVRISELWLTANHIDEVAETNKSPETSFVLGWPTSNVVVSFMTAAARDLWWGRLSELVRQESLKEPAETSIQIVYNDSESNVEYCKKVSVSAETTAAACVNLSRRLLDLQLQPGPLQLWARTCLEEAPYPLIGHERPFAIKLSNLRHKLSLEEGFDLEHCNKSGHDTCHFILRPTHKSPRTAAAAATATAKKNKSSKISGLLRRSLSLSPSVFGVNLSRLDENGLPKPVLVMLQQLFAKGPFTQGIFRKSANVRIVRELRDQIESSAPDTSCLEDAPIIAVAALLKDFFRSLPDPLLTSHLFPLWMASLDSANPIQTIKSILERLPKANYNLLSHLVCVLHHIARRSKHNLMCASNLGVCCGPSLLWSPNPSVNQSRAIPALTETLIRHCETLFGEGVVHLFGEERSDSGAEESTDSLHCRLSLDSLDMTEPPRKDHMSLSRDSGLTLSDCQLFVPESPVSSEDSTVNTSSSTFDKSITKDEKSNHTKTYIRLYNHQWEERCTSGNLLQNALEHVYPNPNFQRQDWIRAQLKRTPRTKLDEHEPQQSPQHQQHQQQQHHQQRQQLQPKEQFTSKKVYLRECHRQDILREPQMENRKEAIYISSKINVPKDHVLSQSDDTSRVHKTEQRPSDLNLSLDKGDFKKECFNSGFKKVKSEQYVNRVSPIIQNRNYHSTELNKVRSEIFLNRQSPSECYEFDKSENNIYGNRETVNSIFSSRDKNDIYQFKQAETIDVYDDEEEEGRDEEDEEETEDGLEEDLDDEEEEDRDSNDRTWSSTPPPPPLPPRLRHLPPVHMNLEDRHKLAGRSRSLPPPPPYRPPPQPRASIVNSRHLGYARSILDDESYV